MNSVTFRRRIEDDGLHDLTRELVARLWLRPRENARRDSARPIVLDDVDFEDERGTQFPGNNFSH